MSSSRWMIRRVPRAAALIIGLISISMLVTTPAQGQTPEKAKVLYDQGIALRAAGKHEQAVDRFRRSLVIDPQARTYLALASSLNEIGKVEEAIAALDAMFVEFDATMTPRNRERAERGLLVLEGKLGFGRLEITTSEKGTIFVDGKSVGALPLAALLRVKEGEHSVRIERDGAEPLVRDIVVVKGNKATIEVPPLPIPKVVEPAPLPIPKVVEPIPKVVEPARMVEPKPVVLVKPRQRFEVGAHVAFMAGFGTTAQVAVAPPTTCGVYCLPSLGLLAGLHIGVPIRRGFLVEFGAEYLHANSGLNVAWQRKGVAFAEGVSDAVFDFDHSFALDGGLAYAAIGANMPIGNRVRIEGRAGFGAFIGQSTETVSGQVRPDSTAGQPSIAPLNIAAVEERTALFVLPVLRSRLGVSMNVGPVWLGIAVDGVVSATKGPQMCAPTFTANQVQLEASGRARVDEGDCADGVRSARPFERLLFVAPEVSVSGSF